MMRRCGTSFTTRGNVTGVARWDVNDLDNANKALWTHLTYNAAGSVLSTTDPALHQTSISYADVFTDSNNNSRGTFAYPTAMTDADGFGHYAQYNYDFGALTSTEGPPVTGQPHGLVMAYAYDEALRLQRATDISSGAYTRYVYGSNYWLEFSTVNNLSDDTVTEYAFDGLGQVFVTFGSHPNSAGLYKEQITYRDAMGRVYLQSNPREMNANWQPAGDDAQGDWVWTNQTYDWKGRPLRTIHPDGYFQEALYDGCGCAGGERVTIVDETNRARRNTSDTLGRMVSAEELSWPDANGVRSVYSTANYVYDALDQVKSITHEGQVRSFDYDGYGRLSQRTTPEQGTTTYAYNTDDTLQSTTDARQVTATYGYNNNRHLVSSISYDESNDPSGSTAYTAPVSFGYDAAGNRTSMSYGLGSVSYHYDQLSRMDWEERSFGVLGPYRLSYSYNLANELTGITGPTQFGSVQVGYNYDTNGRLNSVTGSGVSSYANNISYRAFGAVKAMSFGDGRSLSTSYDNRMRITSWDVANVLGFSYTYYGGNSFGGNNQVNYARNLSSNGGRDSTLDRSYEYDQVGALLFAHSGAEARAAFGIDGQGWGLKDGPYSLGFDYDVYGNMTRRCGWGGEVQGGDANHEPPAIEYHYTNNKLNDFGYDAAGNVTFDGYLNTYNANNQQTLAESGSYTLAQYYDGDGLRVTKYDNGPTTNYLRSTVLGGAVVVEINANNNSAREYVYAGSDLLAVQSGGQVSWVHEDPITKSQRVTDASGNVINTVERDPWGANTNRSSAAPFQPQTFTTYIRDGNGQQDAMARRYSPNGRFSQPDPYGGSYNFSDPQSLNRYSYTKNDPVNFRDPSGLGIMSILRAIGHWLSRGTESSNGIGGSGGGDMVVVQGSLTDDDDSGGGGGPQNSGQMSEQGCNNRLASIFGGPGAVAATVHEPTTLLSSVHGIDRSGHLVDSGVFHLYTNAQGTEATTGLYRPPGGQLVSGGEYYNGRTYNADGTIKDEGKLENYFRFSYNRGALKGVQISFVHVGGTSGGEGGGQRLGRFPGDTNAAGSVRIGNIGGLGGEGDGYNHTHIKVFLNGKLTDPRKVFCK